MPPMCMSDDVDDDVHIREEQRNFSAERNVFGNSSKTL